MDYYITRKDDDTLYHYGRKGMKWGQHIFGRIKKANSNRKRRKNLEKAREVRMQNQAKKKAEQEEALTREEKRAKLLKSTDASELYKNRDLLTTAEINERLVRIDTERRLSQVAESTKTSGMERVNKALAVGRKINEVYEFTNTPVMKALKKQLGITKAEERLGIDKIYAMRDKMSDKQLADALKRASTEKAIKKIIDENAADTKAADARRQVDEYNQRWQEGVSEDSVRANDRRTVNNRTSNTTESETQKTTPLLEAKPEKVSGTVEGEGTSRRNIKNDTGYTKKEKPADYYDPIDTTFVNDTPMSEVRNSEQAQIGQSYLNDLFLLEDKSR